MSTTTALAIAPAEHDQAPRPLAPLSPRAPATLPGPEEVKALQAYGQMVAESGLFPNVTSWQAAVMIARYGQQIGVDEFTALSQIYWIKGVPTCSASLMLSLIVRDHGDEAILPVMATAEIVTLSCKRRGWTERQEVSYTIQEAQRAGLVSKAGSNWTAYPGDMLWARAVSRAARRYFSDTIRGLYAREEIEQRAPIEIEARVHDGSPADGMAPEPDQEQPATVAEDEPAGTVVGGATVLSRRSDDRRLRDNAAVHAAAAELCGDDAHAAIHDLAILCYEQPAGIPIASTSQLSASQMADLRAWLEHPKTRERDEHGQSGADQALGVIRTLAAATTLDELVAAWEAVKGRPVVRRRDTMVLRAKDLLKRRLEAAEEARQQEAINRVIDASLVP